MIIDQLLCGKSQIKNMILFLQKLHQPIINYSNFISFMNEGKKSKIHTKKQQSKVTEPPPSGELQRLKEILKMLSALYEMRIIEKITRPTDLEKKEKFLNKFTTKNSQMNGKMRKVLKDFIEKSVYEEAVSEKKMKEKTGMKNNEVKKKIKEIQVKYKEIFVDGSLKHYRKIKAISGLKTEIQLINIDDWSDRCLLGVGNSGKGCC